MMLPLNFSYWYSSRLLWCLTGPNSYLPIWHHGVRQVATISDRSGCHVLMRWLTGCACFPPTISRRKVEIMHTHSLFTLLGERLMMHTNTVSITTYNTLYEVKCLFYFFAVFPNFVVHFCSVRLTQIFGRVLLIALADFSMQILTEQVCTQVVHKPHPEPDSTVKIQNPSE